MTRGLVASPKICQLYLMSTIKTGDTAPHFTLEDQNGKNFSLQDILGKKNLVIYFYPKDETPGCTAEACSFRDQYEDFKNADTEVIGISADSVESHKKFASGRKLPFILLSDSDNLVRKKYGVPNSLFGLMPGRVTYVVDKQGIVRHVFNSQINAKKHVSEALKILQALPETV
jgi:peroxiredoxin Q/BCP